MVTFRHVRHFIKAYAYRQVGEKDFHKTDEYIQKIRKNKIQDTVLSNIKKIDVIKNNHSQLLEATTDVYDPEQDAKITYSELVFLFDNPDAAAKDSIHTKGVQEMLIKGLTIMNESSDPFHDLGHMTRCLRYARILFNKYHKKYDLDWGILALSITWHDASRSIIDAEFYKRANIRAKGRIPLLLDAIIVAHTMTDSKKSAKLFRNFSKKHAISNRIVQAVMVGISGASQGHIKKKLNDKKEDVYFKLTSDIDLIDLYSIGKFESAMRHIIHDKTASVKFFERSILIASLLLSTCRKGLYFEESRAVFDFASYHLYKFGKVFYPEDTKVLIDPYMHKHILPQYS